MRLRSGRGRRAGHQAHLTRAGSALPGGPSLSYADPVIGADCDRAATARMIAGPARVPHPTNAATGPGPVCARPTHR